MPPQPAERRKRDDALRAYRCGYCAGDSPDPLCAFLLFPQDRELPAIVTKLSSLLPSAVIGMLVVYCLKGVKLLSSPHGIPEMVSCAFVVLLHVWKRNTLLSILGGTVLYMILLQLVFR